MIQYDTILLTDISVCGGVHMSRKFFLITIVFCSLIFLTISIEAGYTGNRETYTFNSGEWKQITPKWSLKADNSNGVPKGNTTYVYFHYFGSLENTFVSDSSRTMTVHLYEDDFLNSNDLVKTYVIRFSGRDMTSVSLVSVTTPGNLEASGDDTAELYLYAKLDKIGNEVGQQTRLFLYSIEN